MLHKVFDCKYAESDHIVCLQKENACENVSGYLRNPCSLSRERDTALNASGTPTADRV